MLSCGKVNYIVEDHYPGVRKMVSIGSGSDGRAFCHLEAKH